MISSLRRLATFIAAFIALAPLVTTSQPTLADTNDAQGGRYRLVAINQGTSSTPYIIDTHTGRVWRQVTDQDRKVPVFVSVDYQNVKGELSKVPNEVVTGVWSKAVNITQPQQLPDSNITQPLPNVTTTASITNTPPVVQSTNQQLHELATQVVEASKELEYWRKALDQCKQGKPVKMLKGFAPVTGEPMYGEELQPTAALQDGLVEAIEKCIAVKAQKEDEIRRLTTKPGK